MIEEYIHEINNGGTGRIPHPLGGYEQIKAFEILPRDLSVEQKEVTPTLKLKRKVIRENWKELIDSMYDRADAAFAAASAAGSSSSPSSP